MSKGRHALFMFRNDKRMSQEQFATAIGYKRDTYSKVENGNREPSLKFCKAIAEAFAIPLSEVVELMNVDE